MTKPDNMAEPNNLLTVALDQMCPMHLQLDDAGCVKHAGPTLRKVLGQDALGRSFDELFELERPRSIENLSQMLQAVGGKLRLRLIIEPYTRLKATLARHPDGHGVLIDMSFGISILDAVRDFELTSRDLAPTDLTIELLYLVEANAAAMGASRLLNARLQDAMIRAEEQALTDTLTGLKNRRAFDHLLEHMIEAKQDFVMMNLDLDYFKQVNDTLGHAAGDFVLQQVARVMCEETRADDIVARVGGDEFILLFPKLVGRNTVAEVAARLIARITKPMSFAGQVIQISASGGLVSSSDYDNPTADRLIGDADAALYSSKKSGRGRFTFSEDLEVSNAS